MTMVSRTRLTRLLLSALLLLGGCSSGSDGSADDAGKGQPARAVTAARIEMRSMSGSVAASGLLVARDEAAVDSELSGYRLAEVFVDEGDAVRAGQALARIDGTLLEARVAQARAQLAQAQAQAAQAQGEANRVRGLDGTGILSDEQIATRRFQAQSAGAAVDVSRAALRDLQTQQGRLVLRAPVGGVILQRSARPGEIASPGGDPMFRIARGSLVELDAEVPENLLISVNPSNPARVILPSGVAFDGRVRFVSPRVDPQTKLGRVRIALPVHSQLRAGGFARAEFARAPRPVPAVPERAVQYEASGPSVMVIDRANRARRQSIRPGARAGGWVELLQGPPVGSRVALGGGAFVNEGDLVKPVASAKRAAASSAQDSAPLSAKD